METKSSVSSEVKRLILYHYRRAGFDRDLRDFAVVLEKEGKRVKVGELLNCEGTFHTPRQIFELVEKGWKVIAVQSCFRWYWNARRYVSPDEERLYSKSLIEYDSHGRMQVEVLYSGYYTKIDVLNGDSFKRFQEKVYYNDIDGEKVVFGSIPKEVEKLFEVEWFEGEEK